MKRMVATSRDCSAPTVLLISSGRKIVGAEELIDLRVLTLLGQIEETAPRGQAELITSQRPPVDPVIATRS
jgi:hypothetical protein